MSGTALPGNATIPAQLRTWATRGRAELAVSASHRLDYGKAGAHSAEMARGLLALGVSKGSRVAIFLPNGPDWIVCWLALARIGAIAVPINTFYQARELGWALRHSDAEMLLCSTTLLGRDILARLEEALPELASKTTAPLRLRALPFLRHVLAFGAGSRDWAEPAEERLERARATSPEIDAAFLDEVESCVTPADPAVMIYSSGSTADPRAAIHSQGSLLRHSHNLNRFRDIRASDRIYSPMPFFWVGGLVFSLLSVLHEGACLLCEDAFDAGRTLDLIERERATIVTGWPHYAKALASHESFATRDLACLRGGNLFEVLPPELRPKDPELRWNSLGMTETCGPHTIEQMEEPVPEALRGAFGHAVPGVEHKIVDPASGAEVARGEAGEICVRGDSLMLGLYKVERSDTFDADGFYHTGDSGHFDADGYLFFQGRLSELIKTGGANVTPREVELALEAWPEVAEAYVVGVPDSDRGQRVAAALVPRSNEGRAALEPKALRRRLRSELAAYKVPREIHLFRHDELPFTDSGKIDKARLVDLLAEAS